MRAETSEVLSYFLGSTQAGPLNGGSLVRARLIEQSAALAKGTSSLAVPPETGAAAPLARPAALHYGPRSSPPSSTPGAVRDKAAGEPGRGAVLHRSSTRRSPSQGAVLHRRQTTQAEDTSPTVVERPRAAGEARGQDKASEPRRPTPAGRRGHHLTHNLEADIHAALKERSSTPPEGPPADAQELADQVLHRAARTYARLRSLPEERSRSGELVLDAVVAGVQGVRKAAEGDPQAAQRLDTAQRLVEVGFRELRRRLGDA